MSIKSQDITASEKASQLSSQIALLNTKIDYAEHLTSNHNQEAVNNSEDFVESNYELHRPGVIEAEFNGAVKQFYALQKERPRPAGFIMYYLGQAIWNIKAFFGYNTYFKPETGQKDTNKAKLASHLGVDKATCDTYANFYSELNKAAERINALKQIARDQKHSARVKDVVNSPIYKFLAPITNFVYWDRVLAMDSTLSLFMLFAGALYSGVTMVLDIIRGFNNFFRDIVSKSWDSWSWQQAAFGAFTLFVVADPLSIFRIIRAPFLLAERLLTHNVKILHELEETMWSFGLMAVITTYLYSASSHADVNKASQMLTPDSFDWWKLLRGTLVMMALMVYAGLPYMIASGIPSVIWHEWVVLAVVSTGVYAIQTLSEELIFRRPLLDGESKWAQYILAGFSSWLFAVAHLDNPEFDAVRHCAYEMGFLLADYFGFAVSTALLTICSGGIELAWAWHFANNLFLTIIIGYHPSPSDGYPLYLRQIVNAAAGVFGLNVESCLGFVHGTVLTLLENMILLLPMGIVESLAMPPFSVDKIDSGITLSKETLISEKSEVSPDKQDNSSDSSWLIRLSDATQSLV